MKNLSVRSRSPPGAAILCLKPESAPGPRTSGAAQKFTSQFKIKSRLHCKQDALILQDQDENIASPLFPILLSAIETSTQHTSHHPAHNSPVTTISPYDHYCIKLGLCISICLYLSTVMCCWQKKELFDLIIKIRAELGRRERFRVFASPTREHFDDAKREDVPPLKTMRSRKTRRVTDVKFRVTGVSDIS